MSHIEDGGGGGAKVMKTPDLLMSRVRFLNPEPFSRGRFSYVQM